MSASELTCKEVVELVTDYLSSSLPDGDRARFEAHLAGCEPCTAYLQQMRATVELTGRLDESALPDDLKRGLLDAFRRWKSRP
jgi:anti-sigma factor RsiW